MYTSTKGQTVHGIYMLGAEPRLTRDIDAEWYTYVLVLYSQTLCALRITITTVSDPV